MIYAEICATCEHTDHLPSTNRVTTSVASPSSGTMTQKRQRSNNTPLSFPRTTTRIRQHAHTRNPKKTLTSSPAPAAPPPPFAPGPAARLRPLEPPHAPPISPPSPSEPVDVQLKAFCTSRGGLAPASTKMRRGHNSTITYSRVTIFCGFEDLFPRGNYLRFSAIL